MKQLSLNEIQNIFKNKLNPDVIDIIYNYYYKKPQFKKGDLVLHKMELMSRKVRIYECYPELYDPIKGYMYNYDYYPSSEGYSFEINLIKI